MARFASLIRLLEQERSAIKAGQFEELEGLAGQKEVLLRGLLSVQMTKAQARQLSDYIGRNQTLLQMSLQGVRDATSLLQRMRKAREGFEAYTPTGRRVSVGNGVAAFERKA